jgi:hypothetical protein
MPTREARQTTCLFLKAPPKWAPAEPNRRPSANDVPMAGRTKQKAEERDAEIAVLCATLRGTGFFTYTEQAAELNRRGSRTKRGARWTAQSVYLSCRRHRQRVGGRRMRSGEVHDLLDGRWRNEIRGKILELQSYGVTRYDDIAKSLNKEGIMTRLGKPWSMQSVFRLMRSIGLQTGKPGRRRYDE